MASPSAPGACAPDDNEPDFDNPLYALLRARVRHLRDSTPVMVVLLVVVSFVVGVFGTRLVIGDGASAPTTTPSIVTVTPGVITVPELVTDAVSATSSTATQGPAENGPFDSTTSTTALTTTTSAASTTTTSSTVAG